MTRPGHVDLDAAESLIDAAVVLIGTDRQREVLAVLMAAVATLILDANRDPRHAEAVAGQAGPPLAEMVAELARMRLAESRGGGSA